MALEIGHLAPDFSLRNQHGETVSLSSFAGKKDVVLMFYPFAFSGVCTGELGEIRDRFADIADDRTEILAVSCDHMYSLRAFADRDGYSFSLLSDYWPHGAVSRAYQIFDERAGCSGRATFIIDRHGVVRSVVHHDIPQARNLDDYLTGLAEVRAAIGSLDVASSRPHVPRDAP